MRGQEKEGNKECYTFTSHLIAWLKVITVSFLCDCVCGCLIASNSNNKSLQLC